MVGGGGFDQWTIPGVAQPPVYTFMALLGLFVVVVGPLAYQWTTRRGRGYLMFILAPILAVATTGALIGYGLVADGLGTQMRIRQLTFVDGRSGEMSERSRVTYFAGVQPRGGVRFPVQSAVFPYPQMVGDRSWGDLRRVDPQSMGSVTVDAGWQRLSSDFLPSRRQRQFVIFRQPESEGRLRLENGSADGASDGSKSPRIVSEFDFDLTRVIVRDHDGDYWVAFDLPAGTSVEGRHTVQTPTVWMGKLYNDFRPVAEIVSENSQSSLDGSVRDLIPYLNGQFLNAAVVDDGMMERLLSDVLKNDGGLPPGFFAALSTPSPEMVGVAGAEVKASVRYVFGTLP